MNDSIAKNKNPLGVSIDEFDNFKILTSYGYDYQPCVQKAIDNVAAMGGGNVLIPTKKYTVNSTIQGKNNVYFVGMGIKSEICAMNHPIRPFTFDNVSNFGMYNIAVSLGLENQKRHDNDVGVYITGGSRDFVIERIYGIRKGIMVRGGHFGKIIHCMIRDTLADGIHLTGASKTITVSQNWLERTGDDAIAVVSYQYQGDVVEHITIENNYTKHSNSRGIAVVGGSDVTIFNNRIHDCKNAGILLAYESGYATFGTKNISVLENRIYNANTYSNPTVLYGGIQLSSSDARYPIYDIKIEANKIYNSGGKGIAIGSTETVACFNIVIFNNLIDGTGTAEAIFIGYTKDITVKDNTIKNAAGYGIYEHGGSAGTLKINNNKIENCNLIKGKYIDGILVRSKNLSFLEVSDNEIIDSENSLERAIELSIDVIKSNAKIIFERNRSNRDIESFDFTTRPPAYIGQTFTQKGIVYIATGVTSAKDWKKI